jgi:4-amino-4-deoxy-L-arabinose transferase-like glycosyltransferase
MNHVLAFVVSSLAALAKRAPPILLAFPSLAAIAAVEATAFDAPEPLGTVYLVAVAVVFVAVLAGFYFYYMRWEEDGEEDKDKNP